MSSLVIRVDSANHIGSGHVMRCLTLARIIKTYGVQVYFCCRAHEGDLTQVIADEFPVIMLAKPQSYDLDESNDSAAWLGVSELADATECLEKCQQQNICPDWVLVDHFSLSQVWEQTISQQMKAKVIVIDGLLDRAHQCDLLINPSLSSSSDSSLISPHSRANVLRGVNKILSGPQYIPLRAEFNQKPCHIRESLSQLLVCFGGVDKQNFTYQVCDVLAKYKTHIDRVWVIVGQGYPYLSKLQRLCSLHNDYFHITVQSQDIASIMAQTDLAIGAGGIMAWERCAMGLPSICWSIAANQIMQNQSLSEHNAIVYLGEEQTEIESSLTPVLDELIEAPQRLTQLSNNAAKLMQDWPKHSAWTAHLFNGSAP